MKSNRQKLSTFLTCFCVSLTPIFLFLVHYTNSSTGKSIHKAFCSPAASCSSGVQFLSLHYHIIQIPENIEDFLWIIND
ncbi:hypothetical protein CDL12_00900 [Handroanthus impetiginosus]|uniref:Uncharacterized protein n=1 Tax=Handroanthus impetiginosus TaxID=429701 RepID=A0A2G9I9B1_9LAMI|nr:hypothetical protein CDL12_00900 [Handroanthus impetiginosus]